MKHNPGFLKLVEEAMTHIKECTIAEVKAKLDRGERFHFIDVREDNEFATDHAKGAVHLGRGILERDIETVIPDKHAEIVLYCGGGFRSALAADNLEDGLHQCLVDGRRHPGLARGGVSDREGMSSDPGPVVPPEVVLPEITLKAVVLSVVLAAVLAGANAYLGLFAGMTVSASIPAAVISMAVLRLFRESNILENNIVQTAASSGEALAAGVIFTIPALLLIGYWTSF